VRELLFRDVAGQTIIQVFENPQNGLLGPVISSGNIIAGANSSWDESAGEFSFCVHPFVPVPRSQKFFPSPL